MASTGGTAITKEVAEAVVVVMVEEEVVVTVEGIALGRGPTRDWFM